MENNSSRELSLTSQRNDNSETFESKWIYGVITVVSFSLNSLFCVVMIRKSAMLKRPHNMLLFTLALADLLTGLWNRPFFTLESENSW